MVEDRKEIPKCTCTVNTKELYYHMPKCPYKIHMQACKAQLTKEIKDD